MTVVKIGGCNGSGKTSLVRALMGDDWKVTMGPRNRPVAYHYRYNEATRLILLGSYQNVCGGMDTISDKEDRLRLIKKYAAKRENIVFFEGLITGKTYGAIGDYSDTPAQKGRWIYAFMDTPFEVCVERVLARRLAAAKDKGKEPLPFDPERTMRPTFRAVESVQRKAREQGHKIHIINHEERPQLAALRLLRAALEHHDAGI